MASLQVFKSILPFNKKLLLSKNIFSKIVIFSVIFYIFASTIFIIHNINRDKIEKVISQNSNKNVPNKSNSNKNENITETNENSILPKCGYSSCYLGKKGKLNVHLIAHTHDDVGWIKTVSEYYYDTVQFILDTVSIELENDDRLKFIYVEMAFFYPWWITLSEKKKNKIKQLVDTGQLEFILGGWSMNDEASTHYSAIIDQHTVGFDFLKSTFGECGIPKIGWQIDPFGHSREQASLFAQFGFDAFINSRIDTQDYKKRLNEKNLEDMWYGSDSLTGGSPIFSHSLYRETYSHVDNFCFDCGVRIKDNPEMQNFNIKEMLDFYISFVRKQRNFFQTNHLMLMMGGDFTFLNAKVNFKNIDILLKHLNRLEVEENLEIHSFYSSPSCYVKAVNEAAINLKSYHGDYFPYSSKTDFYWTGYYTSRPNLKLYERHANSILQVCKQVYSFAQLNDVQDAFKKLTSLKHAIGVLQHHDAITGTSKEYVARQYSKMTSDAIGNCQDVIGWGLSRLMTSKASESLLFHNCNQLNVSICPATENYDKFAMVVYNPMGHSVDTFVRLPVVANNFQVFDGDMNAVPWQMGEVEELTKKSYTYKIFGNAENQLIFKATIPALGFNTYFVSTDPTASRKKPEKINFNFQKAIVIKNEFYRLTFDGGSGLLSTIENLERSIKIDASQHMLFYTPSTDGYSSSGAYVFHPEKPAEPINKGRIDAKVLRGNLVEEVHQRFSENTALVVRLYKGVRHIEVQWSLQLPTQEPMEMITRFKTSLESGSIFFTDANGRQMMKRVRDYRKSWNFHSNDRISSNYYPITNRIFIQDNKRNLQFTVMSDRSQGASSLKSGQLELMLDRSSFMDDGLGVGEALMDEDGDGNRPVSKGCHYITLDTIENSRSLHRTLSQELIYRPLLTFLPDLSLQNFKYTKKWSGLVEERLPAKVHLLTLEPWHNNTLLLRLEHYWERSELEHASDAVAVSLKNLFKPFSILSVEEQALGGNQNIDKVDRLVWKVNGKGETKPKINEHMRGVERPDLVVHLTSMQIRTFVVFLNTPT